MAQGRSTEIITMIKWIRTSRLSIKELSLSIHSAEYEIFVDPRFQGLLKVKDTHRPRVLQ